MKTFLGWRTDTSTASAYVETVQNILRDESLFNNFRSGLNGYIPILEHLSYQDGKIYADTITNEYPHLLEFANLFRENDTVGNPIRFFYDGFGTINPTTLRYIKFAGDIQKEFGDLSGLDLIEIGGGYGGLVNVLSKLFKFNKIKLYDLPDVLKLQKKYLNKFGINPVIDSPIEDLASRNSIIVSNYSWCECDFETRKLYLDQVVRKCKYAFMVVYDVDIDNELMVLPGEKRLGVDTFNPCKIFTLKNNL